MEISKEVCTGCGVCLPYCVVGAIAMDDGAASIDLDGCVECGSCIRNAPCPTQAFLQPPSPMAQGSAAVVQRQSGTNARPCHYGRRAWGH